MYQIYNVLLERVVFEDKKFDTYLSAQKFIKELLKYDREFNKLAGMKTNFNYRIIVV